MIKGEHIVKSYDVFPVIKDVDIELKDSSIYGLIGANGAGKTTLIKVLCGIYKPDSGSVTLDGKEIFHDFDIRQDIGYVPDYIMFYNNFTVKDMKDFYKSVYKNWNEKRYQTLREVFTFSEKKRIKHLSKGMKTQLMLLITLSCMPKVILMDEPTSGLDPFIRKEVLNLIVQDVSSRGTSILISTHNISELEQVCDRVGFMDKGKLHIQEDMDDLKMRYKKVQIAFDNEIPEKFLKEFNAEIVNRYGKVYEVVVDMDLELFKAGAKNYSPLFMEDMDMTLEEIFLYRMGGENHVKRVNI